MKKLYIFALVATLFAACVTDETQDVAVEFAPETLTVSFEEADSRIQLNEAGKTVWTKGDEVSVFYLSNANQKWQYQGETGERTGNLKRVENATATHELTKVVVVYPYNSNYYINPESYNVKAQLPATQTYLANSYGVGGNIMISQGEYNQFSLKSACGWLKLQLTGNGEKVKSIKLKGNNGEQVAGEIYINSATAVATLAAEMGGADDNENTAGGNLVFDDTILTEVVLDCGEGVTLGAEPTAFYITLPPQTFAQGLTIVIEDSDALKMIKSTDKEVVISRNAIQPMAAFGYEIPTPKSNEIWYTSIDGDAVTPYRSPSGSKLLSNTYDKNLGVWILSYEGNITKIDVETFATCSRFASMILPEGVLTINEDAFSGCSNLRSLTIPSTLWQIGYSALQTCGMNALYINDLKAYCKISFLDKSISGGYNIYLNHKLFTSLTLPESVSALNYRAFYYCKSLTDVTLHNQVQCIDNYALYRCENLQQLTLGDGVLQIGRYAVAFCSALPEITIPSSVTEIRDSAFKGCSSLKTIYCKATTPPTAQDWSDSDEFEWEAFDDIAADAAIYVPATSINLYKKAAGWSDYADIIVPYDFEKGEVVPESCNQIFYTATAKVEPYKTDGFGANIVSNEWDSETKQGIIIFDDKVTSIGSSAFWNCRSLTSVTIPDSVTSIGDWAFDGCSSLTSITIGNSVTSIGHLAFNGCSSLKAFYGKFASVDNRCLIVDGTLKLFAPAGLTEYTIPDSVTSIGNQAFSDCTSLKSVTIPDSVTEIGDYAFYCCTNLSSVTIGNGLKSIGNDAFFDCVNLTNLDLSNSITSIGSYAFGGCGYLTDITIPESVTEIGEAVFNCCHNLTNVYFKPTTPPSGCFIMFYLRTGGLSGITIYVPHESVETYKAAENWSAYANSIVGYDFEKGGVVLPEPKPAANEIWYTTTDGQMAELAWQVTNQINPAPTQSYRDDIGCYVVTFSEECYGSSGLTNPCGFSLFDDNSKKKIKTLLFSSGDRLFDNFVNDVGAWKASEMTSLEEINIPDNVTYIREGLFSGLFDLKRVIIGSNVTTIETRAFQGCLGITSITLPENLESIGSLALWDTGITELIIPDKVQTLYTGNVPRSVVSLTIGCSVTNLKEDVWTTRDLSVVYCKPTTPPDNLKFLFYEIDRDMTVYVPTNSVDAYRTILAQYDRVTVDEYDF